MRVVQILGPSYSGSTVLGYMLNTAEGWMFGSEMFRALPTVRARRGLERPQCDYCRTACAIWRPEVFEALEARPDASLGTFYGVFEACNPAVEVLVDASKQLRFYRGDLREHQVVTAKHPLRLLASHLYNDGHKHGAASKAFPIFARALDADRQRTLQTCRDLLAEIAELYEKCFAALPGCFVVRTDELAADGFRAFAALSAHLGVSPDRFAPERFSAFPLHTLGGNRAPYWQRLDALSGPADGSTNSRREFYRSAEAVGDIKVDDKFRMLLTPPLIAAIADLPEVAALCARLGYDRRVPA